MERYGRFIYKHAFGIVVAFLAISAATIWIGVNPGSEDDVLRFLPKSNPQVGFFYDVNQKFGALHVAMVGIEAKDVFTKEFITRLGRTTQYLQDEVKGVHRVLSLTSVADFSLIKGKEGGLQTGQLIDTQHLPKTQEGWKVLRTRVMSKRHIVGQFVNRSGTAAVILCFLSPKGNVNNIVQRVKKAVRKNFPSSKIYWGGTPFISSYIFAVTERDLRRLTPWAVAVIVVITLLVFRDPVGVLLAFVATIFGGLVAFSAMKLTGEKLNLVLGSMPVILFAVGSAYGIHYLVRYYHLRKDHSTEAAVAGAFREVGPAILAAGLTTMAGFLSFLAMDVDPMRKFGIFTALGIGAALLAALAVVPAILALTGRTRKEVDADSWLKHAMGSGSAWAQQHRWLVILILVSGGTVGFYYSLRVKLAVETSSFFTKGSEPDLADHFFHDQFGGSIYTQLYIKADLDDPTVLREIRRISEIIEKQKLVSTVQSVAIPYSLVNEAMVELHRIPDQRKQVQTLASYVLSDPSSRQLMTMNRKEALVHIKVTTSEAERINRFIATVRRILKKEVAPFYVAVNLTASTPVKEKRIAEKALAAQTTDHLLAILLRSGVTLPAEARTNLARNLNRALAQGRFHATKADVETVANKVRRYLRSKECVLALPAPGPKGDPAKALAAALANLGPAAKDDAKDDAGAKALAGVVSKEDALTLVATADPYLADAWKLQESKSLVHAALQSVGLTRSRISKTVQKQIRVALLDLKVRRVAVPGSVATKAGIIGEKIPMHVVLTGMPVLYQGMSKSVQANQIKSLIISGILVLLVIGLVFRSVRAALVGILPAGMTLMMLFGFMGFKGLYLDMSTSMIASIALGTGIDYAIHYLVWWRRHARASAGKPVAAALQDASVGASHEAGTAILANALMVAAAFLMLTMGDAAPLKTFGAMTATAMLGAAVATFLAVPALAGSDLIRHWAWVGLDRKTISGHDDHGNGRIASDDGPASKNESGNERHRDAGAADRSTDVTKETES